MLNSKGQLTDKTSKVIKTVLEKYSNVSFVFATGKTFKGTLSLRKLLGLDEHVISNESQSPSICSNGCVVFSGDAKNSILNQIYLEPNTILKCVDVIDHFFTKTLGVKKINNKDVILTDITTNLHDDENYDYEIAYYIGETTYFTEENKFCKLFRDVYKEPIEILPKSDLLSKVKEGELKVNSICIFSTVKRITALKPILEDLHIELPEIIYTQGEKYCVDIIPSKASKGFGLSMLLEKLNIKPEQVICFGDGMNDLSVFEYISENGGFGISMDNAIPELKNKSVYVTKTNNEDGLAEVLEEIFL